MLFGAKKRLRDAPGKGRMSVMKFQHFATQKRNSLVRVVYGSLLIIISITLMVLDPIQLANDYMLSMKEGHVVYEAFRNPQYNVQMDTYIFNYTNLEAFINGSEPKLKLEEIGPFAYQEIRTDENMRVDEERGTLTMNPRTRLEFIPEKSVAHYDDVKIVVPNLVLICFSTFLADRTNYFTNVGAYYSMKGLGANLVLNVTAGELMWGYQDSLVSLANTFFPGWIDFEKIGILDRFYAHKNNEVEIELKNKSRLYAINQWDKSPGLVQQGYTDWNSSTLCNRLKDSYEGMMISPNIPKDKVLRIFRSYGCKVFPFEFKEEVNYRGIKAYRFDIEESAFNKTSSHACPCTKNCVPDGFLDISGCYYGFPIALSKPYLQDVDPKQQAYFDGPKADPTLPIASAYYEPTVGAPLKALTRLQINVATRTSPGNPLAEPLNGIVLPYVRLEMHCEEPPADVFLLLYIGLVVGPPLLMVIVTTLLIVGTYIGLRGFYEYFRTDNQLILTNVAPEIDVNSKSTASLHSTDTHEGIKEVTLLLNMINETNV